MNSTYLNLCCRILIICSALTLPITSSAQRSLSLEEAISAGLAHSPELKMNEANLDLVRTERSKSKLPFPSPLKIGYEKRSDAFYSDVGEKETEFGFSLEVESPASFLLRRKVNSLYVKSAEEEVKMSKINTIAKIKKSYFRLFVEQSRMAVYDSISAFNFQLAHLAQQRFDAGLISNLDHNLALIERDQALVECNDGEYRYRFAMLELSRLIGHNPDEPLIVQSLSAIVSAGDEDKLVQRALQQRNDYQAIQYSSMAKSKQAGRTWIHFIPNPTFDFKWSKHNDFVATTTNTQQTTEINKLAAHPPAPDPVAETTENTVRAARLFSFGVSFELPLSNRSTIQRAQAKAEDAMIQAKKERMRRHIMTEVKAASKRFQLTQTSWQAYQAILPRIQSNLGLLLSAYEVGEIDLAKLLVRHDRLYRTRLAYYDNLLEYHLALIELERVVGGTLEYPIAMVKLEHEVSRIVQDVR